jgi:hypothetical protein
MGKQFASYTFGECRTGGGQHIEFTCEGGDIQKIVEVLGLVKEVTIPTARAVNVAHGGYGRYSRYRITQHKYAGGGPGEDGGGWSFIEVLEIRNPPDGRCGIVIYEDNSFGTSMFSEWKSVPEAVAAWEKALPAKDAVAVLTKAPGFVRLVPCGELVPWFYAVGDQELIGDYVFPEYVQEDQVYRFGRKFVIESRGEPPVVKTCMGCRIANFTENFPPYSTRTNRIILWSDGTILRESIDNPHPPRPLEGDELWVDEAVAQFKRLVAGHALRFTIPFLDGQAFIGRLTRGRTKSSTVEGRYSAVAHVAEREKPRIGSFDFSPTRTTPDVISFVTARLAKNGLTLRRLEVKSCEATPNGRKWSGLFFGRKSREEASTEANE